MLVEILLLWTEFEDIGIHQDLDLILEDVIVSVGVTDHSMVRAVLWIVGLAHFLMLSHFWDLDAATFN